MRDARPRYVEPTRTAEEEARLFAALTALGKKRLEEKKKRRGKGPRPR